MNRGQTSVGIIGLVALGSSLLTTTGTWVVTRVLSAPDQSASAIAIIDTKLAVVQTKQDTQQAEIDSQEKNYEILNRNVTKLLIHFGIQPDK